MLRLKRWRPSVLASQRKTTTDAKVFSWMSTTAIGFILPRSGLLAFFRHGGSVEENEHAAGTVGNEDFFIRSCPFSGKVRSFGKFSFVRSSELQNFIRLLIPLLRTPNYD